MARRRFFVDSLRNGVAELHGEDARHLTRVLRVEPGQRFEISDNRAAYLAEIAEARGERVAFRVLEPIDSPEAPVRITLLAALFKFDHFEWMIEKATELGVERIVPVEATRTEKGLFAASHKRAERWRRIAREASQQSRRTRMPEIADAVKFDRALTFVAPTGTGPRPEPAPAPYEGAATVRERPAPVAEGIFERAGQPGLPAPALRCLLDEAESKPIVSAIPPRRAAGESAAVLLGPEGGWTDVEREAARNAGWVPVSLGPQVLRAETAAAAAVAVLTNAWMV